MSKENQTLRTGLARVFQMANAKKATHHQKKGKKRSPKRIRVTYIGGRAYSTLINDV